MVIPIKTLIQQMVDGFPSGPYRNTIPTLNLNQIISGKTHQKTIGFLDGFGCFFPSFGKSGYLQ